MADAEDATMELPTAVLTLLTAGDPNPLVPQPYEITVLVLGGLLVALAVAAVVLLARTPMDPFWRLLWLVVTLAVPLLGPVAGIAAARQERRRRRPASA